MGRDGLNIEWFWSSVYPHFRHEFFSKKWLRYLLTEPYLHVKFGKKWWAGLSVQKGSLTRTIPKLGTCYAFLAYHKKKHLRVSLLSMSFIRSTSELKVTQAFWEIVTTKKLSFLSFLKGFISGTKYSRVD